MPDILIRGIGIPSKSDLVVHIYPDGKTVFYPFHSKPRKVEVLELPPHGDLISKQTALAALYSDYAYAAMDVIEEVPVIVPAERREG